MKSSPTPQAITARVSSALTAEERFNALAENYVWFNPHLTLNGERGGADFIIVEATNPDWMKWRPSYPTSPHWYTEARLQGAKKATGSWISRTPSRAICRLNGTQLVNS